MIRLFLIFVAFSYKIVFSQQDNFSYQIIEDEKISDIESKISKDLFFRGEVADYIIENNLVAKITSKKFSSYSQAREFLILWISANPKAAAKFYALGKANDPIVFKGEISYVVTKGGLTERFKKLVETLQQAASNSSLTQEQKRLACARIFEGFIDYGDRYIDTYSDGRAIKKLEVSDRDYSDISAFKVNLHSLFENEKRIRNLLPSFSKFVSISKDKRIKDAFYLFKSNLEALSIETAAVGGRKNLTAQQAEKIKRVLFSAKRSSFSFLFLYKAWNLKEIASFLPDSSLKEKLLFWAKRLEVNFSIFQNPALTDSQANDLAKFLSAQADFAWQQAQVYILCQSIEEKIKKSVFSGYYDMIFYQLMSFFYPENEYRKIVLEIKESYKDIAVFKDKNLSLKLKEEDFQTNFLKDLNEMISKKEKISAISLKMQFLLFEFFLPFDLKLEPGKMSISLNLVKLFT